MTNLKPAMGPGDLSLSLNHKTNGLKLAAAPHWRLRPQADLYPLSAGKFRQQNAADSELDLEGLKEFPFWTVKNRTCCILWYYFL